MTIAQCLEKTAKLLNYFSVSGNLIPKTDGVASDYQYRAISLIDTAQKELCVQFPLFHTCTFSQHALKNLLDDISIADVSSQTVFPFANGASMTFLTDAKLSVSIESLDNGIWTPCAQLETQKYACFQQYQLRFQPSAQMRAVFSSRDTNAYAYIGNLAVYAQSFDSDAEVPPYLSFRSYPLPEDFYALEEISFSPSPKSALQQHVPYSLGYRSIEIARDFDGSFCLSYRAMCPTINHDTPEDTPLTVGNDLAEFIPYYAAAVIAADENSLLSQQLMNIYRSKVLNMDLSRCAVHIENDFYQGGARGAF